MNSHEHNKVCFGPNDSSVFAGNYDGNIISWNLDDGSRKEILKSGKESTIIVCEYQPVTGFLFSGDSRGNFFIWH